MSTFDNIRFVLVGTTHPGNIGAAARAMKTMGLSKLHLVEPLHYPSAEATARASAPRPSGSAGPFRSRRRRTASSTAPAAA